MGFKIKGLKKVFKNPTHSKVYKLLPFSHQKSQIRKKLGFTGKRLRKLGKQLKEFYAPPVVGGSTSINSAGAVIPASLGKSITDMY